MPVQAADAFHVKDAVSGLAIAVSLRGMRGATAEVANGYVVYPAAYEGGADVLQRPYSSGTEQSIAFASRPTHEAVTYDVSFVHGVAGVRAVADTVEFLDSKGAPRLRMAPPYITGSNSTSAWPTVRVEGCIVDASPAPPWGRPVIAPGAPGCSISVDWSRRTIEYPAVLDPTWSVGSTMATARAHHAGAVVTTNGRELALVFGGYAFTSTIASAELFDETTGTWAQTGTLVADVSYAAAITPNSGTALAVGGFRVTASGGSEYDGVQAYSAATGQWSLQGHLGVGREEHTATLLGNGNILVAGGFGAYPTVFANALVYNPATGTASAAGAMQSGRGDHTATLLQNGKVLVVGGINATTKVQNVADLYDPTANAWSVAAVPPAPGRFSHVAPLLASGKVLIAGGEELPSGIAQTLGTAIYDPTSNAWTAGPPTAFSHYTGTASVLTQGANVGKVVLAGGDFALSQVELFDPSSSTWKSISPLLTGRDSHVALTLQSGVLYAGGSDSNGNLLSSTELYEPDVAATAPQWPPQSGLTVTSNPQLAVDGGPAAASLTISWPAASDPNGVGSYTIYENGQAIATVPGSSTSFTLTGVPPGAAVTFTVQATDPSGAPTGNGPSLVYCVPTDVCHQPGTFSTATNACTPGGFANVDDGNACTLDTCDLTNGIVHHECTPIDRTASTSLQRAASFLYSGSKPIQTGVDAGAMAAMTMAVIHGTVRDANGAALPTVTVTVAGHPELGSTITQGSGAFDIAVNGGQPVRLHFALSGYLPVERIVQSPWQDHAQADGVTMIPVDSQNTVVDLSNTTTIQVARGSVITDDAGTRQATVMLPPSTEATMTLPDGGTVNLPTMTVRATEYTVGASGPSKMPGPLPPTSAYTYAVELSADEAIAAGATHVALSQPVPFYVENFLSFPTGSSVPTGYYDKAKGAWVPSQSGVVIQIVSENGGTAQIDVNGDGAADTGAALTALGITTLELQNLASIYHVGQSLWRVQVPHFSVYDCNLGYLPPPGAGPPYGPNPPLPPLGPGGGDGPGDCKKSGSIIECQRQSLAQQIPIAGTPYSLHYESDHQVGRQGAPIQIPLSGSTLPGPVQQIDLEVRVGGRVFEQSFPALANQATTFTWDGHDTYGRLLQGSQPITVRVGNAYETLYGPLTEFGSYPILTQFSINGGFGPARAQIVLWNEWHGRTGPWDDKPLGLGGWTLNVHHSYDPFAGVIHFGDGSDLTPASTPRVSKVVAGTGGQPGQGVSTDGIAATLANIAPAGVAVGPDGSFYIVGRNCVRRVGTDGIIHTVAGQCAFGIGGLSGDGGPATSAQLSVPGDLAFAPDGSLYIADTGNNRIRRVDPSGIIHTVAGGGAGGSTHGDGGPAVDATLFNPSGVDVAADGAIYVADQFDNLIRRVGPDGIISTVAGGNPLFSCRTCGSCPGYGGSATGAYLCAPSRVRVAPDGSLYITGYYTIDRIGPDGIITRFAGTLSKPGYAGDGGPATAALMGLALDIAIGPDGSVYVGDGNGPTVRRIDPDGIINRVAGIPSVTVGTVDNGPATAVAFMPPQGIRVAPDGTLYIADQLGQFVHQVAPPLPGFPLGGSTFEFASQNGTEVYTFDDQGRHLQTLDAFTGATIYQFGYDSAGRLSLVEDVNGNATDINRDESGNPSSIVTPFGQTTALTVDANGYLASVADPAADTVRFTYSGQGLMATMVDARGGLHQFSYDTAGRLVTDEDSAGGSKTLTRTELSTGFNVAITTALGTQASYQTTMSSTGTFGRLNVLPDGTQASLQFGSNGVTTTTSPDGTTATTKTTPDPRFGMLSPMPSVTTMMPSGLTSTQSTSRSVFNNNGVLSFTEQNNLNGNAWTRTFNSSTLKWTMTSPAGRQTTMTVDAAGRPTQISVPGVNPITTTYDAHGRLSTLTQGGHTWTTAYDPNGYLSSATDPLNHVTSYQNDAVGRALQVSFPDGRTIVTSYDPNGNPTSITLPGPASNVHAFTYNPIDQIASYTPPSLGSGSTATSYSYNLDHQITNIARPDGVTVTSAYDMAGRLTGTTYPQGTLSRTYDATGRLSTLVSPSGEMLTYGYDGLLRSSTTWAGLVAGSLTFGRDANLLVTSQTLNGNALMFGFDVDRLLTSAGSLAVSRDGSNGRVTGTTLGSLTDAYTYDTNGLFASYTASFGGSLVYGESVLRDAVNRITQKTEAIGAETHVWGYTYDGVGRLTDVTKDGAAVSHYAYDNDDNRTTFTGPNGTLNPAYDAQDRLLTYGGATYAYTANGELVSKMAGGQNTSYAYDALGNLLHVGLPNGTAIDYVVDGENHRVGKKVNGTLATGYLYQAALKVVAQLDGSGNVVARFVFGTKPNAPDYYTTSAGTFRILSDHLGSPRLIVDVSSGATVERIDYDEFGNVTQDTSPGLTPFGFAGGLYDRDTGLVRFGARDYDPSVGRWTSKDPLRFRSGSLSLYGYVVNDPVNLTDYNGMGPCSIGDIFCCFTQCQFLDFGCLLGCVVASGGPGGTPPQPSPPNPAPPECAPANDNGGCVNNGSSYCSDSRQKQQAYGPGSWKECSYYCESSGAAKVIGLKCGPGDIEGPPCPRVIQE
jgi:RHS repeat-associated protein